MPPGFTQRNISGKLTIIAFTSSLACSNAWATGCNKAGIPSTGPLSQTSLLIFSSGIILIGSIKTRVNSDHLPGVFIARLKLLCHSLTGDGKKKNKIHFIYNL
jgi:hypothetical protein